MQKTKWTWLGKGKITMTKIDMFADVAAFHKACDVPFGNGDVIPEFVDLRRSLVNEEHDELIEAYESRNATVFVDSIADLNYVLAGTVLVFGLFDENAQQDVNNMYFRPYKTIVTRDTKSIIKSTILDLRTLNAGFNAALDKKANIWLARIIDSYMGVLSSLAFHTNAPYNDVWNLVQSANMAKVDSVTGKVKRREDGKILKPDGWIAPDAEIKKVIETSGFIFS